MTSSEYAYDLYNQDYVCTDVCLVGKMVASDSLCWTHDQNERRTTVKESSDIKSNQIKFYLVTHYIYYVHFIASDVTEEIL